MSTTTNTNNVNCVNGASTDCGGVAHGRGVARCKQPQIVSKRLHREVGGPTTNFRIGTLNVGTLRGKAGEVVETMTRRGIDLCCVQEVRWRGGNKPKTITGKDSTYKLFWKGNDKGNGGVGIFLAEKWWNKVAGVDRVNDRILALKLLVGQTVTTVISVYAPQQGLDEDEKDSFYDELRATVAKTDEKELVIIAGDLNGHVGRGSEGYEGVHGGRGYGTRNKEGDRILEFGSAMDMVVTNTMFSKRDSRLITFETGKKKKKVTSQIDYILIGKKNMKLVKDVKVIAGEEIAKQHRLVIGDLRVVCPKVVKKAYVPRRKTWKLKNKHISRDFQTQFGQIVSGSEVGKTVDGKWGRLMGGYLNASDRTCGWTTGPTKRRETWWWNNRVEKAIKEKRRCFHDMKFRGGDEGLYAEAKRNANREVYTAQNSAVNEKCPNIETRDDQKQEMYKVSKQMQKINQDVVGEQCVRDDTGTLACTEEAKKKAWRSHYNHLLNVEFEWKQESLSQADPVAGPIKIEKSMVKEAICKMKNGKAAGPSGVTIEMVKAGGELSTDLVHDLISDIVGEAVIPKDWKDSIIINCFKGKGDATDRGNYRGLKLLEHVMKILERVIDKLIREQVEIDSMQFGFMPGRSTTDAIFIVRQLQEKFLAKGKTLYLAFVDLEKAFDRVPREVVWWAMRKMKVPEVLVRAVQAMYHNASARVRVGTSLSEAFEVKVGVHQGSVLSPLLFIMVLQALSTEFKTGCPWELLYADDLALIAETMAELTVKLQTWKQGMEAKGLRVNMGKTKVLVSNRSYAPVTEQADYPCSVCHKGVGSNSNFCVVCKHYVHWKCSGIKRKQKKDEPEYTCRVCTGELVIQAPQRPEPLLLDGVELETVDSFCYLGDTIGAGGGAGESSSTRVRCGWQKFRDLLPVLTSKRFSQRRKGDFYGACVRSVLLYGCETWAVKEEDILRLERTDHAMIRWICGVSLKDKQYTSVLLDRLGLLSVREVMRRKRLRWFGHVERRGEDNWVSGVRTLKVQGSGKGLGALKSWGKVVEEDLRSRRVDQGSKTFRTLVQDQEKWRSVCNGTILSNNPRSLRKRR